LKHLNQKILIGICILFLCHCKHSSEVGIRPNILLIVADDLGYTDLACYGSEIRTPNIDALAKSGSRFSSFCTASTCSPARAMLLSGVTSHLSGFGTMTGNWAENQKGQKGYEGYLNFDIVTFPQLLKDAGYHTSIAGKWHMSQPSQKNQWPVNRGFTRSFCFMRGAAGHFHDKQPFLSFFDEAMYFTDSTLVDTLPHDFYSSEYYADKAIEYINESKNEDKPFFHFLSFSAPHWPLQVKDEHIDLYKGYYEKGYETLATKRLKAAKEIGIVPNNSNLAPFTPNVKPWNKLTDEEKLRSSKSMEIYAAMIERLDHHTGRVINHLKSIGEYENTMIVFIADNGAEGNSIMTYEDTGEWVARTFDNSYENMGRINSYIEVGAGWAQASSQPFKWYKAFSTEGGIRAPAIIHYPEWNTNGGTIKHEYTSIMDLAPTFLELAGVTHPQYEYKSRPVHPMQGKSMLAYLTDKNTSIHDENDIHAWELYGRRGVRKGIWKAEWMEEPYGNGEWELYNLEDDLSQQYNLAKSNPEKLEELILGWKQYELSNGVVLPDRPTAYANEVYWNDKKK